MEVIVTPASFRNTMFSIYCDDLWTFLKSLMVVTLDINIARLNTELSGNARQLANVSELTLVKLFNFSLALFCC